MSGLLPSTLEAAFGAALSLRRERLASGPRGIHVVGKDEKGYFEDTTWMQKNE